MLGPCGAPRDVAAPKSNQKRSKHGRRRSKSLAARKPARPGRPRRARPRARGAPRARTRKRLGGGLPSSSQRRSRARRGDDGGGGALRRRRRAPGASRIRDALGSTRRIRGRRVDSSRASSRTASPRTRRRTAAGVREHFAATRARATVVAAVVARTRAARRRSGDARGDDFCPTWRWGGHQVHARPRGGGGGGGGRRRVGKSGARQPRRGARQARVLSVFEPRDARARAFGNRARPKRKVTRAGPRRRRIKVKR